MASYDEVIPPGQVGKIRATLKTDHYNGPVVKTITVTTNDPALATTTLTLKARIAGSVQIFPTAILGINYAGPRAMRPRIVVRKDETEKGDLVLSDIKTSQPWLKVEATRVAADGQAVEGLPAVRAGDFILEARLDPIPGLGPRNETVSFSTGLSREPTVSIPVSIYVPPPIQTNPQELILLPTAEAATGIVYARLRADLDPAGLTVEASPAEFEAKLNDPRPTGVQIVVTWAPKGESRRSSGSVTLRHGTESVVIPVRLSTSEIGAAQGTPPAAAIPKSKP